MSVSGVNSNICYKRVLNQEHNQLSSDILKLKSALKDWKEQANSGPRSAIITQFVQQIESKNNRLAQIDLELFPASQQSRVASSQENLIHAQRAVLRATTSDYKPLEEQTTQTILLYAKALEKKMTEAIESAPIVELEQSDDMPEEISMLALSTAIKMCIDRPWIEDTDCHLNAFFAKKLGMTLQEFNKFEEVTLRLIDYRTHIPKEELRKLQTAPQTTSPADCQAVKVEVKNLRMPIHQAENLERTNQEVLKKHKVIPDKFKTGEALATQKQECLIKIEKLSNELERLSIAALTSSEQKTPSAEDAHNECLMKIKSTQKALSKAFMELE